MSRCIAIIEDYTNLAPGPLKAPAITSPPPDVKKTSASSPVVKQEKEKKQKPPRDPNAPKRPPSAYILYQNEVREAMRKEHKGVSYKEVLQMISQHWKDLPDAEKQASLVCDVHRAVLIPGLGVPGGLCKCRGDIPPGGRNLQAECRSYSCSELIIELYRRIRLCPRSLTFMCQCLRTLISTRLQDCYTVIPIAIHPIPQRSFKK